MSKVMKIRHVGAGFHAAGQTDRRDEAFRNFANSHKKKWKTKGSKMDVIMCLILVSFFAVQYTGYLWPLHQAIFNIYDSITYSMGLIALSVQYK
jgi:exonuclease I